MQLSKAALLRIAHGLAAALEPWLSHLECSSCGSRTTTTWCEGRSCRCAHGGQQPGSKKPCYGAPGSVRDRLWLSGAVQAPIKLQREEPFLSALFQL